MAPLSISILLLVLTVPANARMFRRSNMAALAVIDLLSNLSAAVLAVVAAANHAGVWSLVLQMLTSMGIKAVAVNALAFKAPRFVFNWASVSSHTVVGGGIIAAKVADSTGKMAETGLVSRRFGSADLGSYGFATQVSWSVAQAVANPVWFAFYMQMLQSPDPRSAEDSYRRVVRLVLMLALPVAVWTAVNSHLLISRLLGPSWGGSVLLIALIFPSQVLCLCTQSVSAALYARGLTRSQFIATVVNCSMRCLAVSIPFGGFKWVAVWIGIANITYGVVGLINAKISLGWSITGVLDSLRGPLVATVAAGLEAHFIVSRCAPSLATIVVSGVMSALVYVIVLCLLDWGRVTADVQTVMGMIRRDGSASLPSARVRAA
jgi:PST family polysaccharide transporter